MELKSRLKRFLLRRGYYLRRIDADQFGRDPFQDMARLTEPRTGAILFDVGANTGQTTKSLLSHFCSPTIHAFEPSPSTFQELKKQTANTPELYLNNLALGSRRERQSLIDNSRSTLSSLLEQGKDFCWENTTTTTIDVEVESVDSYCDRNGIARIDVLKSDTQGFDLEVLKGSLDMLRQHRIHLVFVELNCCEPYAGMPLFEDLHMFLKDLGFLPVSFYNQAFLNSRLAWMDGLYVDPQWQES